jgi:hypothetical protein
MGGGRGLPGKRGGGGLTGRRGRGGGSRTLGGGLRILGGLVAGELGLPCCNL